MKEAFIIMQIGNSDLDAVCANAIVPALRSCGLDPRRVDKHNEGQLLKSAIVGFMKSSEIIVADLTNERPNCYLEVGYTMGLDKSKNLIMTAREDHNHNSPNYRKGGPRIHFDLSGYDILYWNPNDLDGFREELEKRVKWRLSRLTSQKSTAKWDVEWITRHRTNALAGLLRAGKSGFMEIQVSLPDSELDADQVQLLEAADKAQIDTFGWPIGVVLNNTEHRPRPVADGIVAEILSHRVTSFDYWTIRGDGSFYLLKSLFEDVGSSGIALSLARLFFDTRIVRITETLLYFTRLYSNLGVSPDSHIVVCIRHGGLKERVLSCAGPRLMFQDHRSKEDEVCTEVGTTLDEIKSNLVEVVEEFTQPLFMVFDFFKLDRKNLEEIVHDFEKRTI
jgi:hypothetical protein